jgi:hypothetical protein
MFDIKPRYDGYRLNHKNFGCVTNTTYEVGTVRELRENDTALVRISNCGDMSLPCFYHCGKKTELMPNSSLKYGASAFYECKNRNPLEVIVVCVKNQPIGFIGFADHVPRQCCFEPFYDEAAVADRWTITRGNDRYPDDPCLFSSSCKARFVRDGNDSGYEFRASTSTSYDGPWGAGAKHFYVHLTCTDLSFYNGDPVREKDTVVSSYINGTLGGKVGRANSYLLIEARTKSRGWYNMAGFLWQSLDARPIIKKEDTGLRRQIGSGSNDILTGVRIVAMAAGISIKEPKPGGEGEEEDEATPYPGSVSGRVKYICFEQHSDNIR